MMVITERGLYGKNKAMIVYIAKEIIDEFNYELYKSAVLSGINPIPISLGRL